MGGHKLKHRTGTLLLILTISGVMSGLGAPADGEGGARAQHDGAPLKLASHGWKRRVGAKHAEESLLRRRHDIGNSPVEFAGWRPDWKVTCNGRVSAPGSHNGESLVRWAFGSENGFCSGGGSSTTSPLPSIAKESPVTRAQLCGRVAALWVEIRVNGTPFYRGFLPKM
jgi:hypothetical protein